MEKTDNSGLYRHEYFGGGSRCSTVTGEWIPTASELTIAPCEKFWEIDDLCYKCIYFRPHPVSTDWGVNGWCEEQNCSASWNGSCEDFSAVPNRHFEVVFSAKFIKKFRGFRHLGAMR